jgi:hypothetical protein
MSIERIFYCDGPDCDRRVRTADALPDLFLTVRESADRTTHFCGWDCALSYGASIPPEQVIPAGVED